MNEKLDIQKVFDEALTKLNFSVSFWRKIGELAKKWIKADMQQGILQGTKTKDYYRSSEYVEKKKRYMKDETGTNYPEYRGISIKSNYTDSVNMMLTGFLIEGLKTKEATATSVTLKYNEKDYHKIENNAKYGRNIANLNEKNREKFVNAVKGELRGNIKKIIKKKIELNLNV